VRDNIAYGRPDADTKNRSLPPKPPLPTISSRFPSGYDTVIGELGGRLSGGEKQRLCIARALIKDAPILILDEATSSLDSEAEAVVQKALENLMHGRTTLVIAHRLSTIAKADHIVVIVDGKIVEQGTHASLWLSQKGEYAKLHDMQFAAANGPMQPFPPVSRD
jgi:subfamily B ATP-binding cassette protein MsbA